MPGSGTSAGSEKGGAGRTAPPQGATALGHVRELFERLASVPSPGPELVNRYYALCIPFYQEFLGNHWHTGYYLPEGPVGPRDQLRMEWRIAESADLASARDVLEVGCGVGGPACHLASRITARYRGPTPNVAQLELARRLARQAGLQDRVTFDLSCANELPYANESFDVVRSSSPLPLSRPAPLLPRGLPGAQAGRAPCRRGLAGGGGGERRGPGALPAPDLRDLGDDAARLPRQ